jgi:hypothetical protein
MSGKHTPFHDYREWLIYLTTGLTILLVLLQIYALAVNVTTLINHWST